MSIFDILGPVMVGPSSSHTAGAVRIGLVARKLLKDDVVFADVRFHGSFAATYRGHGTDRAIAAGLLGMQPDDMRIPDSLSIAKERDMKVFFSTVDLDDAHPNTALLTVQGKEGCKIVVQASSVGGGRIMVNKLDGITVNFSATMPTLIVHNYDTAGHVAFVTQALFDCGINIASMQLYRSGPGGYAVMVLETDQEIPAQAIERIAGYRGLIKATYVDGRDGSEDGL